LSANANAKKIGLDVEFAREIVRQKMATSKDASKGGIACLFDGDEEVQAVEEVEPSGACN